MEVKISPIPMVDLKGQYHKIKEEVLERVTNVIDSGAFINGPEVKEFTRSLADYIGVKHVIPCANGTDALQIALMALDLQPGDEIITTPFTFIATAEVIALLRLKPVFVDVNSDTFNIDATEIESAITNKTKCIIPVHLYGQSAAMESILKIAKENNLFVIEDNAQAIGASYQFLDGTVQKTGAMGDIGCISFYPSKNLGAYGDGGAITTNSDELAEKINMITNHGAKVKYYHEVTGVNSRLDSIQAAILNVKLKQLDQYIASRQQAAAWYDQALAPIQEVHVPKRDDASSHVFHQYTIKVSSKRDELKQFLLEKSIASDIYYPVCLHLQQAYAFLDHKIGDFPISEELSTCVLSLPMHTELLKDQVDYIASAIQEFYKL